MKMVNAGICVVVAGLILGQGTNASSQTRTDRDRDRHGPCEEPVAISGGALLNYEGDLPSHFSDRRGDVSMPEIV